MDEEHKPPAAPPSEPLVRDNSDLLSDEEIELMRRQVMGEAQKAYDKLEQPK